MGGFYWLFGLGFIIFLGIWLSSDFLSSVMGDASLAPSIKAASLMFLIIPFTALFRGFFQSVHLTEYVAISQVVEQMVRVFGIIIVTIVAVNHLPIYSIGVLTSIATIIGAVIAGLWLTLMFRRKKTAYKLSKHQKLKGTFVQSLLIGIAVYSITYVLHLVLQVVDVFSLVDLLRKYGLAFEEAKIAKGVFDRSHSMVQLGLVIGSSLALALIPALNKDLNQQLLALKWTFYYHYLPH
ncbi:oligosaccharide flippase family protein [Piscibacillus salipiscarius]|uniref:oligosaccharide flippase family protein n=1 Tax=Piscibacillus salipiscarius TaxID=299480 RepID=UPI0024372F30|nr:oligosaccharide flippase family protein [Piscibacillus salipiscarius]